MAIMRYIKPAFRYAAMPGIVPRLKRFDLRFPFIAYLIAQIYAAVRLLPASHAYLNPANTGKYGVGAVVMAATDRLRQTRAADQIIVFAIITVALALLFGQFAMLILMLGIDTAQATSGASFASMFETPDPEEDIALLMLDMVFGVPDVFGSGEAPAGPGDINPFQQGLHELFRFYSYAVLALGGVILLYYVLAVVLETAQTGSPFGERFDSVYAPLRLVIAVGLLMPIHYGLNSGQHLTLHIAKWGSGLATNGWDVFNSKLAATSEADADGPINMLAAEKSELLAKPVPRKIGSLVTYFHLANMCAYHYEHKTLPGKKQESSGESTVISKELSEISPEDDFTKIKPYIVRNQANIVGNDGAGGADIDSEGTYKQVNPGFEFSEALQFYNYGDVTIRFGHQDYGSYGTYKGGVKPLCGEVTISVNSLNQAGAIEVYKRYFEIVKRLWYDNESQARNTAIQFYRTLYSSDQDEPDPGAIQQVISIIQASTELEIEAARQNYIESGSFNVNHAMEKRGWGGAAIWFNDIAAANGSFFSAVYNIPKVTSYPHVMQKLAEHRSKNTNISDDPIQLFKPDFGDIDPSGDWYESDKTLADAGYKMLTYFEDGSVNADARPPTGNPFYDLINMMMGTQGLFSIRDNREIHPLAQITSLGRGMLDTSMRNFAIGAAAAVPSGKRPGLEGVSKSMVGVALMGALLGAVLHYVLPFMPFIYFFFAVSNWVKEVFEAMIGVPLWAVAHLQLEGKGLPGSAAGEGYFLLFGIFLRPILILFGLIAAIAVFSAQAIILHDIFDLAIINLAGHGSSAAQEGGILEKGVEFGRSTLDEFFYTVLYVIILYMMATASFKLIDAIPDKILRWAGSDAKPFSDQQDDATGNLVRNVAIGTRMALQGPLQDATVEAGQGAGHVVKGASSTAGSLVKSLQGGVGTAIGKLGPGAFGK